MQVPGFLARQFVVSGSLRNTDDGFSLAVHNPMGDGVLVGVGRIVIDGHVIAEDDVYAIRDGDPTRIVAARISRDEPVAVRKGDRVTLHVVGGRLERGHHRLQVELHEATLGVLRFSLTERLVEG